ncbi:uncharacterized protein LOC116930791 [Daphnia magna]|uniref:uncharacterized protein LOC116930791 n=1 Tax=Daphnia magna TaxID=35525 RepID=UPI001E1BB95E|nr:uncharacterized protein LOC116930791 [Daphnia magna]
MVVALLQSGWSDQLGKYRTLSDRLNALPKESSELLENSLSVQLDASDFSLQETEIEYNFESDPLGDGQHMTSAMHEPILEYPEETSTDPAPQKKRCLRSNYATDSDADATSEVSVPITVTPVYKRYTDAQLSSAIKAVVEEGIKQVDACIKYGIPFTTLTRKWSIYRAGGGCCVKKEEKISFIKCLSLALTSYICRSPFLKSKI